MKYSIDNSNTPIPASQSIIADFCISKVSISITTLVHINYDDSPRRDRLSLWTQSSRELHELAGGTNQRLMSETNGEVKFSMG